MHTHYTASSLWNAFRAALPNEQKLDFSMAFGCAKSNIKKMLLERQKIGDQQEWDEENFQLMKKFA